MKAYLKRDGTKFCAVLGPTPVNRDVVYSLEFNCGDENYAQLLVEHFNRKIQHLLEGERARYYRAGWKDAKGKRRKREGFPCCLQETEP